MAQDSRIRTPTASSVLEINREDQLENTEKTCRRPLFHYADDTQIYLSFRPHPPVSQDAALGSIENCVADVRAWMLSNRLLINDTKTEFVIIGSRQQLSKIHIDKITVGESTIEPVKMVRNLGAWFDSHMSMNSHIGKVCSKAFRSLYNIRQIRKFLSEETTKILVHAFVTSHLDYCNSLLSGLPQYQYDRLQRVLNAAARVVCLLPKFDHITPILSRLHWLLVRYRVTFKILLLGVQGPSCKSSALHLWPFEGQACWSVQPAFRWP
ncbi:hypothetical protein ACROYT_G032807 [Oculina patagonica]